MALGIVEKLGLQRQARTLQAEVSVGDLGIIEKINKQKQWREIVVKLQADAAPAVAPTLDQQPTPTDDGDAPESASDAAVLAKSVVGFSFDGIQHAQFAKDIVKGFMFSDVRDLILSNEPAKIAVFWNPAKGYDRDSLTVQSAGGGVEISHPRRFTSRALKFIEALVSAGKTNDGTALVFPWQVKGGDSVKAQKDGETGIGRTVTIAVSSMLAVKAGQDGVTNLLQDGDIASAAAALNLINIRADYEKSAYPVTVQVASQWVDLVPADSIYAPTFSKALVKARETEGNNQTAVSDEQVQANISDALVGFQGANATHPDWAVKALNAMSPDNDLLVSSETTGISVYWTVSNKRSFKPSDFTFYWKEFPGDGLLWGDDVKSFPERLQKQATALREIADRTAFDLVANKTAGDYDVTIEKDSGLITVTASKGKQSGQGKSIHEAIARLEAFSAGVDGVTELLKKDQRSLAGQVATDIASQAKKSNQDNPITVDVAAAWLDLAKVTSEGDKYGVFAGILKFAQKEADAKAIAEEQQQQDNQPPAEPDKPQIVADFLADKFVQQDRANFVKTLNDLSPHIDAFISLDEVIPHAANWIAQNVAA